MGGGVGRWFRVPISYPPGNDEVGVTVGDSCLYKIQTQKSSKERLFIMIRTRNMQIFGEIPFVKPQNDT